MPAGNTLPILLLGARDLDAEGGLVCCTWLKVLLFLRHGDRTYGMDCFQMVTRSPLLMRGFWGMMSGRRGLRVEAWNNMYPRRIPGCGVVGWEFRLRDLNHE